MDDAEGTSLEKGRKERAGSGSYIPIWKRYSLTIAEAADYYHIGEAKLRTIVDSHPNAEFAILNGNRILIKRVKFEKFLDEATTL